MFLHRFSFMGYLKCVELLSFGSSYRLSNFQYLIPSLIYWVLNFKEQGEIWTFIHQFTNSARYPKLPLISFKLIISQNRTTLLKLLMNKNQYKRLIWSFLHMKCHLLKIFWVSNRYKHFSISICSVSPLINVKVIDYTWFFYTTVTES